MKRSISQERRERIRAQQRKGELSREEARAKKHQQMLSYERKKNPNVMWDTLLNGQTFEDVKLKKLVIQP